MPTGINAMPITKNVGKTVPAVNIGCHAGSRCCLNALSVKVIKLHCYIFNASYFLQLTVTNTKTKWWSGVICRPAINQVVKKFPCLLWKQVHYCIHSR